jgi:hypothetical protein
MSAALQQVRQNGGECSDAPANGPGADGAGCLVGPGRAGGDVGGPALLGLLLGRGGGRLDAEELEGKEHLVDGVDGEGPDDAERVVDGDVDDAGGNVELVLRVGGDVERVGPVAPGRLRADGVAGGLERLERVELREDVALHQRHLLLLRERVERTGLEAVEGVVRGREHRVPVAVEGVVELAVELRVLLRRLHQPDERRELPALLQHRRHVRGTARRRRGGRGLRERGGEKHQRQERGDARRHCLLLGSAWRGGWR